MNALVSRHLHIVWGVLVALAAAGAHAQSKPDHPFGPSKPIMGDYIVVFKDNVANPSAAAANLVAAGGGRLLHTYTSAIKGFAATLPEAAVQALQNNPNVDYIEQDQTVSLSTTEGSATWGIDRIDQLSLPLSTTYNYDKTGAGVYAFIIDTGIRADHTEFTGRVLAGFNSVSDNNGTNDCNGHGTHVSGTVGGTTYGVAKDVKLIPVRVLNCRGSGSWSGVIAGIDFAANDSRRPAVANMSLGGGLSASVNAAVAGASGKGVTMAVAAGNETADACGSSPASEPSAITVGATTSTDARASYSNFGTCVDIFAPGSAITSAWNTSSTSTNTISGTSMATPHVTGVAALVTQANQVDVVAPIGFGPADIAAIVISNAAANRISSPGTGSPNLFLYSLGTTLAVNSVQNLGVLLSSSASLVGTGPKAKGWQAKVVVKVFDVGLSADAVVANATVKAKFDSGSILSCVTGSTGTCTFTSATLATTTAATKLTVTGVTGTRMSYSGSADVTILNPKP
jgi:aqualysin 1